jgi:hypothetical protein
VDRVSRLAPLSGLAAALLFALGNLIWAWDQPARGADTEELLSFYERTSIQILIGGTISLLAIVFLVWFGSVLREHLAAAEGTRQSGLPSLALSGTVLIAAAGLAAETINMAGAWSAEDGRLTASAAQTYFDVSYAFGAPAAGAGFAMVALPTGLVALRTGRPLGRVASWLALLLGIAALSPVMWTPGFGLVTVLGLMMLVGLSTVLYRNPVRNSRSTA